MLSVPNPPVHRLNAHGVPAEHCEDVSRVLLWRGRARGDALVKDAESGVALDAALTRHQAERRHLAPALGPVVNPDPYLALAFR